MLAKAEQFAAMTEAAREPILIVCQSKTSITSKYDFNKLLTDSDNLRDYINGFSKVAREIMDYFDFDRRWRKQVALHLIHKNMVLVVQLRMGKFDYQACEKS